MRPRAHPGGSGSSSAVAPQDVISLVSATFGSCSWARDVFLHVPAFETCICKDFKGSGGLLWFVYFMMIQMVQR